MDLIILKKELGKIRALGFVKTHRAGNTGIGKTLEDLLNIK
ncbi:MAG: MvaI/BcnI family restriction endonuclease, partial [Patescibacteria group bacterium]